MKFITLRVPAPFSDGPQFDEDGIIQEIFKRIETTDKTFIEFGVGGTENENNSIYLLKKGWNGMWIEGVPKRCEFLKKAYSLN